MKTLAKLGGMTALLLALAAPASRAQAPGEVIKATHGDWQVVCASGQDVCVMRQVGRDSRGQDALVVTVRALDGVTADNGEPVPAAIDIVAPLGVALQAGVRVTVDGGQERAAPFNVCVQQGCLVRSPMGTEFLEDMKRGVTAAMKLVVPDQNPPRELVVNISLRGFTAAFGEL